tara:strand:+ start:7951 stop:8241 length:291 start_codon:yes stop_codon:yes gene_type:complete
MSYTVRTVYTKPSAEVSLHTPPTEYTALINTFFDAGKVTQKPVESVDGLTTTYTMVFKDEASFNEFKVNAHAIDNGGIRSSHCNDNSISYSIEQGV